MSNYVFLIDQNKTPLNPIHPRKARKLLSSGKAAVFRQYPFTLILHNVIENPKVYPLTLKIDPGSKTSGFALVNNRNEVIFRMELEHRGYQIKEKLTHRSQMRRGRRSRNLRYRKPRFLNRARHKGWLPPSLMHLIETTMTWVNRFIKFAPIGYIVVESVKFDMQKMQNPEISGEEYQQGELQGYEVREYLLEKWGRACVYCGKENVPLEVEHIHPKSKGGSDRVSNLTLACTKCNQRKGNRDIRDFLKRKQDLCEMVLSKAKKPLKDAAAVNVTRNKLVETLGSTGLPVMTGRGSQTKHNRKRFGIQKTRECNDHSLDAACVGEVESLTIVSSEVLTVKAVGQGGRQRCQTDKYGYPTKHRPLRPIHGYRSGDIVKVQVPKGKNAGEYVARLCPYSNGRGEIYPQTGRKRLGINLKHIESAVYRMDGYKYTQTSRNV